MSKTSQRKQSAYSEGREHGRKYGRPIYIRRPHKRLYELGVSDEINDMPRRKIT